MIWVPFLMQATNPDPMVPQPEGTALPIPQSGARPTVADYLALATRDNTRRSYASAVRHFEVEWGGLLPATTDSVLRYLAEHATALSASTLSLRVSALARWHNDQGFADPTRHPMVRQMLRGIRTAHPAAQKQAKPLQLGQLESIDEKLSVMVRDADSVGERLRHLRDRSLLLTGFWRGFRGDELINLRVENTDARADEGMVCYLPHSKADRNARGRQFAAPALSRLCPVAAYLDWIEAAGLKTGPVYRAIDQWGRISDEAIHPNSLIGILRSIFERTGVPMPEAYSSHSLRRGFATWATDNGWDLKSLMEYVGWRDVKAAMRYAETNVAASRVRIEKALRERRSPPNALPTEPADS